MAPIAPGQHSQPGRTRRSPSGNFYTDPQRSASTGNLYAAHHNAFQQPSLPLAPLNPSSFRSGSDLSPSTTGGGIIGRNGNAVYLPPPLRQQLSGPQPQRYNYQHHQPRSISLGDNRIRGSYPPLNRPLSINSQISHKSDSAPVPHRYHRSRTHASGSPTINNLTPESSTFPSPSPNGSVSRSSSSPAIACSKSDEDSRKNSIVAANSSQRSGQSSDLKWAASAPHSDHSDAHADPSSSIAHPSNGVTSHAIHSQRHRRSLSEPNSPAIITHNSRAMSIRSTDAESTASSSTTSETSSSVTSYGSDSPEYLKQQFVIGASTTAGVGTTVSHISQPANSIPVVEEEVDPLDTSAVAASPSIASDQLREMATNAPSECNIQLSKPSTESVKSAKSLESAQPAQPSLRGDRARKPGSAVEFGPVSSLACRSPQPSRNRKSRRSSSTRAVSFSEEPSSPVSSPHVNSMANSGPAPVAPQPTLVLPSDRRRSLVHIPEAADTPAMPEPPRTFNPAPIPTFTTSSTVGSRSNSAVMSSSPSILEYSTPRDRQPSGTPSVPRSQSVSSALRGPPIRTSMISTSSKGYPSTPAPASPKPAYSKPVERSEPSKRRIVSEPPVRERSSLRKSASFSDLGSKIKSLFSKGSKSDASGSGSTVTNSRKSSDDDAKSVRSFRSTMSLRSSVHAPSEPTKAPNNMKRRDSMISISSFRSFSLGRSKDSVRSFEVMHTPASSNESILGHHPDPIRLPTPPNSSEENILTTGQINELRRRSVYNYPSEAPSVTSSSTPPVSAPRRHSATIRETIEKPRNTSTSSVKSSTSPQLRPAQSGLLPTASTTPIYGHSVPSPELSPVTSASTIAQSDAIQGLSPVPDLNVGQVPHLDRPTSIRTFDSEEKEPYGSSQVSLQHTESDSPQSSNYSLAREAERSQTSLELPQVPSPTHDSDSTVSEPVEELPVGDVFPRSLDEKNIEKILTTVERTASLDRRPSRRGPRSKKDAEEAKVPNEHIVSASVPATPSDDIANIIHQLDSPLTDMYLPASDMISNASLSSRSPSPITLELDSPRPLPDVKGFTSSRRHSRQSFSSPPTNKWQNQPTSSTISSPESKGRRRAQTRDAQVSFSSEILVYNTYSRFDYDRRPEPATCYRLTPQLAQDIRRELNTLKRAMPTHPDSVKYTHLF